MSQADFADVDQDEYDDFTNDDMDHFRRGGRDIPRKYRVRDDREHYEADPKIFENERGRDI